MAVLFIGEEALKQATVINENVDMKVLVPVIKEAQEMHIHPILGTGIYNELVSQVTTSSVSSLNQTLLENYIQPALIQWIKVEAAPEMVYKWMNKTIAKKDSDNSVPASLSEIHFIMDRARNKAQWYTQRLINYLCENHTDYPLYNNPGSGVDVIKPANTVYTQGMFLGGTKRDRGSLEDRFQAEE